MNNLFKRLFIAVPAAAIGLIATWLGGWYFTVLAVVLTVLLQYEMLRLLRNTGLPANPYFSYAIGLFIVLVPFLTHRFEIGSFIFLLFIAFQVFNKKKEPVTELISTLFCGTYIPFGFACLILLRNTEAFGFLLTILLLLMIWGNDTLAFLGGKKWGHHLLAPDISPKKTWEGFWFGILGAAIGLAITFLIFNDVPFSWGYLIAPVFIVSVFGPLGDLLESKLKRAAGMKDSSDILPGHGGFFDRLDALILAAPAFYLYVRLLL